MCCSMSVSESIVLYGYKLKVGKGPYYVAFSQNQR